MKKMIMESEMKTLKYAFIHSISHFSHKRLLFASFDRSFTSPIIYFEQSLSSLYGAISSHLLLLRVYVHYLLSVLLLLLVHVFLVQMHTPILFLLLPHPLHPSHIHLLLILLFILLLLSIVLLIHLLLLLLLQLLLVNHLVLEVLLVRILLVHGGHVLLCRHHLRHLLAWLLLEHGSCVLGHLGDAGLRATHQHHVLVILHQRRHATSVHLLLEALRAQALMAWRTEGAASALVAELGRR